MSANQNEFVNINIEPNNEEDADVEAAWAELAALQRELSLSQRPLCCLACTSIEMLLASLCSVWILFSLFEGTAGFDIKRYEAIVSYVMLFSALLVAANTAYLFQAITFCMFSGLISEQSKLLIVGIVLCAIELFWNLVAIHVLTTMFYDPISKAGGEPIMYIVEGWPDLLVFFKQMAFSDFHAYFALFSIKIGFISAVLVTALQLNNVKKIERKLNRKRQRLGETLNARLHRDNLARNQLLYAQRALPSTHTAMSATMSHSVNGSSSTVSLPPDLFNMDSTLSTAVGEEVRGHLSLYTNAEYL